MKERIKQLLEHHSISPAEFAQRLGIQRSAVSHLLSGRNNPGLDLLQKILREFTDVSPDWLLLGDGPVERVIRHPESNDEVKPLVKADDNITLDNNNIKDEEQLIFTSVNSHVPEKTGRQAAKVIVLYDDGRFEIFKP